MKGEAMRIAHVDSGICIRSEVLHGVICLEVHVNGLKKKKKKKKNTRNQPSFAYSDLFNRISKISPLCWAL
jgi:hypothetical protein